ncbi:MAG: hypothetical protein DHS80DRAFT_28689 [Piptocephalis tieghemiana]|nr:MAG: hypothetical protein DHS80DRAFT_28689 [Piptocephalis tieghemiana]
MDEDERQHLEDELYREEKSGTDEGSETETEGEEERIDPDLEDRIMAQIYFMPQGATPRDSEGGEDKGQSMEETKGRAREEEEEEEEESRYTMKRPKPSSQPPSSPGSVVVVSSSSSSSSEEEEEEEEKNEKDKTNAPSLPVYSMELMGQEQLKDTIRLVSEEKDAELEDRLESLEFEEAKGKSRYFIEKTCDRCGKPGHISRECTVIKCRICGELGHTMRRCRYNPSVCNRCGKRGHIRVVSDPLLTPLRA